MKVKTRILFWLIVATSLAFWTGRGRAGDSGAKEGMIKSAVAAAPAHLAREAGVVMIKPDGSTETVRESGNGFTCMPDNPSSPGKDPMCADAQGWKWVMSWVKKEQKPANDQPGMIYMLQGGSDLSATDPWATKTDKYISSPPHYMIVWPFDSKTTGLPTAHSKTGTWIMWANTPYAHLMVNQNPIPAKQPAATKKAAPK
jgi:hypothetical protein